MGQLVSQSGSTALATSGANPWAEAAKGIETGAYLKFNGNDGRYSFGQDDEDLPTGSRVVGDMETLAFGFMCWVDSNVEEEVLVPVIEGKPPMEHELTDYGPYDDDDGWREAASISLVIESYGDDDQDEAVGTPLLWKTSTGGQVRQIRKLSGAFGRVVAQHPGEFPIIELGAESYVPKNKKHGKIKWSPALKIVGWISAAELEGLTGSAGEDDDDFEEPAPKGKKALPAPEPEEDEAPARGRGRRQAEEEQEDEAPARGRRAAPVEDDGEDEAPAPRRGRREAPPADEDDEDEAPAPRRGRRDAAPAEEADEDEDQAPAPRRGRRNAAPAEEAEDEAPAPRRGRREAAPAEDDGEEQEDAAPARGRRGGAPGNARLRKFD